MKLLNFKEYLDTTYGEADIEEQISIFEKENGREPNEEELYELEEYSYQSYISEYEDRAYEEYKDDILFGD